MSQHDKRKPLGIAKRATLLAGAFLALSSTMGSSSALAEAASIRIATQPGLTYLALFVMQNEKLIEKAAAAAGLGVVTPSWIQFSSGNAINDAVISGAADVGTAGVPPFLLLWAKSRGTIGVRGIAAYNALPLVLVTRDPKVRTIEDFGPRNRIALPGVGSSSQAVLLQMAVAKAFGDANFKKLDEITITRGHPDAMAALLSNSEIDSHFTAPPYLAQELAAPGVHQIVSSKDIYGGDGTIGVAYATGKFHDANPKLVGAFLAALDEAIGIIAADKSRAADDYVKVSGDKLDRAEIVAFLNEPVAVFSATPQGTMQVADFMSRTGSIKVKPASWKDLFFTEIHARPGS